MAWSSPYESRYLRVDPERGRFQVNRRAFNDPEVFALERTKILLKSWMVLGHESEVARPGDYIVRQILDRSMILVRDRDGLVRAFINSCPHRGAQICRDDRGNRKNFSCPYHGWIFDTTGALRSRNTETGYHPRIDEAGGYDLRPVAQLGIRGGFVFINFDPDAIPLEAYLGGAGDRIDLIRDHSPDGLEVIAGCHEYSVKANYKLMCENSADGYHLGPTHGSYLEYARAMLKDTMRETINGRGISLGNGHGGFEMDMFAGRPLAQWLPIWGEEARVAIETAKAALYARVGETRGELIANWHRNMILFPCTVMNDERTILVRSILPVAHNAMVVRAWAFGPVGEVAALRRIRLDNALSFLGPGGFATPDDVELLESCQRAYDGGGIDWNDVSKGFDASENTESDARGWADELQMRAYWLQYDKMMSA